MHRILRERGAAAVEFALVVPILIALVLGIAAFGRAYNIQSSLSMAAREGARAAAIADSPTAGISAGEDAAVGFGLSDATALSVGDDCTAKDDRAVITVSTTYDFFGLTGFFGSEITMVGRGEMRCGG